MLGLPLDLAFALEVLIIELGLGLALVVVVGPRVTARLTKSQTDEAWSLILPRLTEVLRGELQLALAAATPTPEAIEAQRVAFGQTIRDEVEAVAERMGKLGRQSFSQSGVDSRTQFAAAEEEFLSEIATHPQGGALIAAAVEHFGGMSPKVYKLAVRAGPDGVPAFLAKHGPKLQSLAAKIGLGNEPAAKLRLV